LLRKALGLLLAMVMPFAAGAAFLTSPAVTASQPATSEPAALSPDSTAVDPDIDESATDRYGNPVSDAVARYQFDATGSLYETHSPQTEVPRLRPPRT